MSAPNAGLCASCTHARTIESSRGATFIRCELSFSDSRFARYPALPVVRCEGYASRDATKCSAVAIEDQLDMAGDQIAIADREVGRVKTPQADKDEPKQG